MIKPNTLILGDNLEIMKKIDDDFVDLIYIDPPFYSQIEYNDINGKFSDVWESINQYLEFMEKRIKECYRVLKKSGVLFLHCDFHCNAYLRILLDKIFGYDHFLHEIIWKRRRSGNFSKNSLGNIHDTIFLYSKSSEFTMHPIFEKRRYDTSKNSVYRDVKGLFYTVPLVHTRECYGHKSVGKIRIIDGKKYIIDEKHHWVCTQDKINEYVRDNLIHYQNNTIPRRKIYIEDKVRVNDIWDDIHFNYSGDEYCKFPTQKPEELIERILTMCSNEGDIILDSFAGSGTTLVVAKRMRRKYIGIEKEMETYNLAMNRIKKTSANASLLRYSSV